MPKESIEALKKKISELEKKLRQEVSGNEKTRSELEKRSNELTERLKELNCLLQISRLSERPSLTFESYILEALRIIIASFETPEIISAELRLGNETYCTPNFSPSRWKLGRGLMDQDNMIGYLTIYYAENKHQPSQDPFTRVEKNFIIVITRYLVQIIKSKRYENELKKFREIFAQSPNMIIVTDSNWNIEYINKQVTEILGYTIADLNGKAKNLFPFNKQVSSLESISNQLLNKKSLKGELQVEKKDGKLKWVRGALSVIENLDKSKSFVAIFEDISKEVDLQEKYREEHEKYKTVMDHIPVSISLHDRNGKFVFVNPQAEKNLHLPASIINTKTIADLFPEEGKDSVKAIKGIFSDKKSRNSEILYTINGVQRWFEITRLPILDQEGKVHTVMSIAVEITDKKKTENLLHVQHNIDSLQSIGDSLPNSLSVLFDNLFELDWVDSGGLYLINRDREVLELVYHRGLSQQFAKEVESYPFESANAQAIFSKVPRFVKPDNFLPTTKASMVRENIIFNCVLPLVYQNEVIGSLNLGSKTVSELNEFDRLAIQSIATRVANLIQLVITQDDLRHTNENLSKALKSLQENRQMLIQKSRLESLGELSAGLAHEINQPLSVIALSMENLELRLAQGRFDEKYIAGKIFSINQNIQKIRKLIDHVRIFSRDQKEIIFERIDINQTIRNSLSLINEQLRHRRISVTLELDEKPGFTLGNVSRLEQVFLNLIANSRDALDEKERTSNEPGIAKKIRISTRRVEDMIEIDFWDNGTGINKQNLQKVFDPFFSTKPPGMGTGLGLPIAYGIIREMKGEIIAKSSLGKFTRITLILPFHKSRERKT
jgi:PAS domain S-box-containing protein